MVRILGIVFVMGVAGSIGYPNLVRATEPALSLTITNASSSALTLKVMLIIALVGMPLVVGYTVFAYHVFKGKVRPDDEAYCRKLRLCRGVYEE